MFPVVARGVAPPPPSSSASTAFGFRRFHLTGMRRTARFSSSGRLPEAPDSSGPDPGEAPVGPSLPAVRVFTGKKKKRLMEAVPVEQKQPKVEPLLSRKPSELPDIEEFAYKSPNGSAFSGLLKRNSDVIVLLNGVVSQVKPRGAPPPNWETVLEGIRMMSPLKMLQWIAWDVRKLEVLFLRRKGGSLSWFHHSCQAKQRIMLHMAQYSDSFRMTCLQLMPLTKLMRNLLGGYERWVEQRPWYMCRYSCAPHMQSAWLGFQSRQKADINS